MSDYHRGGWEERVAQGLVEGMAVVALLALLAVIGVLATIVVLLVTELGRVYKAHAFHPGNAGRVLWISLAALLGLWLLAGLLLSAPTTAVLGLYLGAWAFLGFIVSVEACDWWGRRHEQLAGADLDDYLDFPAAGPAVAGRATPSLDGPAQRAG